MASSIFLYQVEDNLSNLSSSIPTSLSLIGLGIIAGVAAFAIVRFGINRYCTDTPALQPQVSEMKIGRQLRIVVPQHVMHKKALLIGISYERNLDDSEGSLWPSLDCPHRDVRALRKVLIDVYGYNKEDIIMMLDGKECEQRELEPTRDNILREIQTLVGNAQPGDHFFFHYSGHSSQIENKDGTEEDGLDEVIIPSDCRGHENCILDNDLRSFLVDALPLGSSLVAVFDTCHSGSLLDLPHYRCNRVVTPWISKRHRRSDLQRINVRRQDIVSPGPYARALHVFENRRVSTKTVMSHRSSIDLASSSPKISVKTRSLSLKSDVTYFYDPQASPVQRCSSPVQQFCDGHCIPSPTERPHVISVSAAKDNQLAWEDADGTSLTMMMIDILKQDSHPSLEDLMRKISHRVYDLSVRRHEATRDYSRELKAKKAVFGASPEEDLPMPEAFDFQDPQLSSYKPLDLHIPFTL